MNFKNYYEEFGISENATQEEIKNAYKKLAKKYHPDANPGISEIERKEREEKLKEINEYKDILTNETLKEEYDQKLQEYKIEEEKRRQEEQIRKQYEEEIREYQRQRYNEDIEEDKSLLERFKEARRESLNEERSYSFVKRHSDIDKKFFNDYYKEPNNIIVNLGNKIGRITLHALGEFITQGERMTKFKGVSFPKYVMRNRYNLAAGAIILTMTFSSIGGLIPDKEDDVKTIENKIEDIIDPENYKKTYILNEYHTIKGGETLSQLAYDAGISNNSIRRPNADGDGYFLKVGEEVIIPYQVSEEDLEYYTTKASVSETTSLEEFAQKYNTDVETLQTLNPEAIILEAGNYYAISDTLVVPNFINQEELEAKKESTKQYQ